ncbi:MAG: hypothetical protein SGBAC_001989 [Bacillariaceae sp.]
MATRRPSLEKVFANKRSSVVDALETKSQPETLAIKRTSVAEAQPLIQVETFLSRKAYPLGTTLVGTVLIRHPPSKDSKTPPPLRKTLKSIVVYAAGFCRIDPRWHNATDYSRIYGSVHPFIQQVDFDAKLLSHGAGKDTVCFWATNGLELMTLPERKVGKLESKDTDDGERLAFTYRIELPMDLPHSINATTCKYYYMMNILIKTQSKQKAIHSPFVVLTNPQKPLGIPRSKQDRNSRAIISGGRVKFGQCQGMAHAIGLPCHLSATEIHRPKGQVTVLHLPRRPDIQTLPVKSPSGKTACVLTFIGATKITPGSRLQIEWDFPREITPEYTPCYQVSACLMGEESALYEDGKTKRTQTHIFDTCHEFIDPGITQRVSKYLLLSVDSPCNLITDVMELTIKCQVDITIQEGKNGKYNNLKIELPCHVLHSLAKDRDQAELEDSRVMPITELLGVKPDKDFPTEDIVPELKVLSLEMEKRLRKTKHGLS